MKTEKKPSRGHAGNGRQAPAIERRMPALDDLLQRAALASHRFVLVEDSEPDAELIVQTLLDSGLKFTVATVDSREALEAELSHKAPSLILSDYCLPEFDGSAALEIATLLAPGVPFIFVTGVLGEEVVIEMLKKGATDYVLKSRLTRLVPAVNRALRESDQRRENLKAQEKLRRSYDQLRALTGHLRFVREEERTRMARRSPGSSSTSRGSRERLQASAPCIERSRPCRARSTPPSKRCAGSPRSCGPGSSTILA